MDGSQEDSNPSVQDTGLESMAARNDISDLKPDLSRLIQHDYIQKQTPEGVKSAFEKDARYKFQKTEEAPHADQFDLNKVINWDALKDFNVDSKEFKAKLDASTEKAERYINQHSIGFDGNSLNGEAAELKDQALKAEREALVEIILARMSLGQTITPEIAIDVSVFGAAIDARNDIGAREPITKEEIARKYAEIFANSLLQEPSAKGFDAWTKIIEPEKYKIPDEVITNQATEAIREQLKQQEPNSSAEDNPTQTNPNQ